MSEQSKNNKSAPISAPYGVAWIPHNTKLLPNSKIAVDKANGRIIDYGLTFLEAMAIRDALVVGGPRDGFYVTF